MSLPPAEQPRGWPGRWGSWLLPFILAGGLAVVAVRPVSDLSPWLHLKIGGFLLTGHRFGQTDPWSPFADGSYQPTQWLPAIVGHLLHDSFGLPAIAWMRAVGIVLIFVALLHLARQAARPAPAVAVALLALVASWADLTERPQLLGFVLLVPVITAWWRSGHDLRPRWWLIPYTWLFASCHGLWSTGVVIGAAVVAGLALDRRLGRREAGRLSAVVGGSLVAAGLTPLGPALLLTPLTVGRTARVFVAEWLPVSAQEPAVALTLLMLATAYVLWLVRGNRPPYWKQALFVLAIAFALVMDRTVPIGAFLAVPLLAEALHGLRDRPATLRPRPPRREISAWTAAAAAALVLAVPLSSTRAEEPVGLPTQLVADLRRLPDDSVIMAEGDLTGWLLFTSPQLRPVMDIRIEAYPAHHLSAFVAAMQATRGWADFVRQTGASAALVPVDSPLPEALVEELRWSETGRDAGYVLLEEGG
jgi:hypothetical protein